MSICIMFRKCEHCGHRYTYNPGIGDFGLICPKCRKGQSELVDVEMIKSHKKLFFIDKRLST